MTNLPPLTGGLFICVLYTFVMLYQLQILVNGEWENTVYPPCDKTIADRRLSTYVASFPEESYALLEVPIV